ncbi:hypothetical protein ACRALDRAFT_1063172, partial [Sodiomyces alcalophilus JCM 7366]|uniref:uncharacterized protein n=1 Tax=Sodiomyces alcalophilus JCM 7366 TaxID=591952 RepID=UPI0039B42654
MEISRTLTRLMAWERINCRQPSPTAVAPSPKWFPRYRRVAENKRSSSEPTGFSSCVSRQTASQTNLERTIHTRPPAFLFAAARQAISN